MTQTELLHAFYGAATVMAPVTATAVTITAAQPEIIVPAGFMAALGKRSSSLELDVGGYLTTNTTPTWSFGLAYTTASPPVFSAATPLCTPTTAVAASSSASGSFNMHLKIGLSALSAGAHSTIWCSGVVTSNQFSAAPLVFNPAGTGGNTMTVWQSDLEYYLWPYVTLTGTVTSNTLTTQYVKLYGEN